MHPEHRYGSISDALARVALGGEVGHEGPFQSLEIVSRRAFGAQPRLEVGRERRAVAVAAEERSSGAEDGEAEGSEKGEGPGDRHGPLVAKEDGNSVTSAGPGPGSRNLRLQLKLWL